MMRARRGWYRVRAMTRLLDDRSVVQRVLDHIDRKTTDVSEECWREPVANYCSPERLEQERTLVMRRHPTPFCPSAALPDVGSYLAREAAGTPLLAVRGRDRVVRVFRNACRHRGTQLAEGSGCAKAFVCRYHGWTYTSEGRLHHVPHEQGFPGLDKELLPLVPVEAVEKSGLVLVTQDGPSAGDAALDDIDSLVPAHAKLIESNEQETAANWKILIDSFLEGYHTRFTHRDTFYPVQYDNLTLVETFGRNHRITFPFRTIEKLRNVPLGERAIDGRVLTYVYHLFPNVSVVTLPEHVRVLVYEPLAVDRTRVFGYTLSAPSPRYEAKGAAEFARAREFAEAGGREDTAVSLAIQRGLASGANECFVFGRFEGAVAHFHRSLQALIDGALARQSLCSVAPD
jgi:phenylpropionate dioxygenase-like ring-hydroxylating dioxygenase large terminal subunit